MHLSLPKRFPLLCLFRLPLQVSSVSNFCPDTRGQRWLTCSVVLRGGRNTANKYHWCVWGLRIVSGSHWVCPHSQSVCFPGLHCSGSRLLCQLTVYGGPWVACTSHIYAVQVLGYRLSWACVLCALFVPFPGQSSSGNQVLGERTLPRCGAS